MEKFERSQGEFAVTTDRTKINLDLVHDFLVDSYWAKGIPRSVVEKSVENSLCFSIVKDSAQVGFARVVTDYATFAYLGDVFVLPDCQGQGAAKFLMQSILEHPELQGLRRFCLGTWDAHTLYRKFGFIEIQRPENWMEIVDYEVYER